MRPPSRRTKRVILPSWALRLLHTYSEDIMDKIPQSQFTMAFKRIAPIFSNGEDEATMILSTIYGRKKTLEVALGYMKVARSVDQQLRLQVCNACHFSQSYTQLDNIKANPHSNLHLCAFMCKKYEADEFGGCCEHHDPSYSKWVEWDAVSPLHSEPIDSDSSTDSSDEEP